MSINKLERALQWLRKDDFKRIRYNWDDLRRAIMNTIGTSKDCFKDNKYTLIKLQWIKARPRNKGFVLTGKDITGVCSNETDEEFIQRRKLESDKNRVVDDDSDDDPQKNSDTIVQDRPLENKRLISTDEFGNSIYSHN